MELRDVGFLWGGTSVSEDDHVLSQVARMNCKLVTYQKPLLSLIAIAPTGFPARRDLVATLISAQRRCGISDGGAK